ncbi:MAG: hypothetical protein HYV32_06840, partial [Candidatus Kerfeldbacteria bacterium]|nr:hypothetical protein [Candidatus Kerfeldbacteria bacterium]
HIEITQEGGAVVVDDATVSPIAFVNIPWAKDAAGNDVETYFTTDGQTLTQHIIHNVEGITYPVTADPRIRKWYGWDFELNRSQTYNLKYNATVASIIFGVAGAIPAAGLPSAILGGAIALNANQIDWIYGRGGCVKISVTYGWLWYSAYYGGNCR